MARKKERAFFICPRWRELVGGADKETLARALRSAPRTIEKIATQNPVAYATLHGVLAALRGSRDIKLDVESCIVDTRSAGR
jgi:hypothetical protein